jgi:hypothetical protein
VPAAAGDSRAFDAIPAMQEEAAERVAKLVFG